MTRNWRDYNFFMLGCVLVLTGFSLALVYSATKHGVYVGNGTYATGYFVRHVGNIAVGIAAMLVFTFIDYHAFQSWAWPLYLAAIVLLAIVLLKGTVRGGAQSWLDFGVRSLQPSEIAKLLIVMALAAFWARNESRGDTWMVQFGSLILAGVPLGMIFIQPDFGTAFVVMTLWAAMAWSAGMRPWQIVLLLLIFIPVAYLGWTHVLDDEQRSRLLIFTDPDKYDPTGLGDSWNIRKALEAIGTGGIAGQGWLKGPLTQTGILPVAYTDFIFAASGEELGFVGSTLMILFHCIMLWQGVNIAQSARDTFGRLLAVGITAIFFCHIMVNIGMNMTIMPVTGIPLPFISYGGSFTLITFAAVGLLQSVALRRRKITFG
ncbi:rod shape-determining protein RodA [Chloroflexia bacterium SDU3-3]|nr:rod shape-determining protein RodA [Chloroflexia bacterium SDU3-3]